MSEWVDAVEPISQDRLYFEKMEVNQNRYNVTAWIPYNSYNPELYKIIVTQLKSVRNWIDSYNSFAIKRSKQAANAISISSFIKSEVEAAMNILTELTNFRIKSKHFKTQFKPITKYVQHVSYDYKGSDILGATHTTATEPCETDSGVVDGGEVRPFLVTIANFYNVKIFVHYDTSSDDEIYYKIKAAFVGKPDGIDKAKDIVEELVASVNNGADECECQQALIKKMSPGVAQCPIVEGLCRTDSDVMPTPSFKILQRLPSNVIKECSVNDSESVAVENKSPALLPPTGEADTVQKPVPAPDGMMHQRHAWVGAPSTSAFYAPSPTEVFNSTFAKVFSDSFIHAFLTANTAAAAHAGFAFKPYTF